MSLFVRLKSWLRAATFRSRLEREMDEELAFHLESYTQELIRRGVSPEEAARRARIEFGGVTVHKEEMRASLGLRLWDDLRADLRYAVRMLVKSPVFTIIAVGSLALGIGANTAIFTLAKQVLLDRLTVPHPEQLILFHWEAPKRTSVVNSVWGDFDVTSDTATGTSFPYPIYQELRANNHVLQDLFAFKRTGRLTVSVDGEADVVQSEMVSGNYYQELGIHTALGRPILPSDDTVPGNSNVVVISDGYWTKRFGRSQGAIGKVILLNSIPFTIIGVNPPHFTGAENVHASPEVFVPFSTQPTLRPNGHGSFLDVPDMWWMQIMARPRPGISQQTATAALNVVFQAAVRSTAKPGKDEAMPHLVLADGSRGLNESARSLTQPVYVLMALAGLVLLLACTNIADLLLARSAARQREISVRLALGADRMRLLRQILTESLLLSFLGGLAGLFLGYIGFTAIPRLMSTPWEPLEFNGGFDGRVFAFTAGISVFTGLLFGLVPAWRAMQTEVNADLKDGAQTTTHRRKGVSGKAIVAFQIALSTILVVGAVLFARTLANLDSVNPGFNPDHLVIFSIQQPKSQYPAPQEIALHHSLDEKFAAIPGVESVTLSAIGLIAEDISEDNFVPLDSPQKASDKAQFDNAVGEQYFATMGIPIVAGRSFNSHDTETAPMVAIINQALAHRIFPGVNPIGQKFRGGYDEDKVIQIVGICANTRYSTLRDDPPPLFYLPYRQVSSYLPSMNYEIRTRMGMATLTPLLRHAVQSVDKNLPLIDVRTQQQQIDQSIQQERTFASLTAGFGSLALILACIGIYGIMAYTVTRRTNEIGIRLALGAQAGQVMWMILSEACWLAVAGAGAGLGVALLITKYLRAMLFGLKPEDPLTLLLAALLLLAVALLASFLPARAASRVNPIQALRHE